MAIVPGQRINLAVGELLKLEIPGVQRFQQGTDLVLLLPSEKGGVPVRVVVAKFFANGSLGMVQLGVDGQIELLTAQSAVNVQPKSQANGFDEPQQDDASKTNPDGVHDTCLFILPNQAHDLRIADTQGLKDLSMLVDVSKVVSAATAYASTSTRPSSFNSMTWDRVIDVIAPEAPTIDLPSGAVVVGQVDVLNHAGVQDGVTWTGHAEAHSVVTLTCTDSAGHTIQAQAEANDAGQWSIATDGAAWLKLVDGPMQAKAVATDASGNASVESAGLMFKLDKDSPEAPTIDLPSSAIRVGQVEVLNLAGVEGGVTWTGHAEAHSVVTLTCTDSAGHTIQRQAQVNDVGQWSVSIEGASWLSLTDGTLQASAVTTDTSGNTSVESTGLLFQLDKESPDAPTIDYPSSAIVVGDVEVLNLASVQGGVTWTGHAEAHSVVTLTCTDSAGHTIQDQAEANGAGQWSIGMGGAAWLQLTDGTMQAKAVATDASGNKSAVSGVALFELHKTLPGAPSAVLDDSSDSGTRHDTITNATQPRFAATATTAGNRIRIFFDKNQNGVIDATEPMVEVVANSQGAAALTSPSVLTDGTHQFLFTQVDVWGNESAASSLFVTLDTHANAVTLDPVTADDTLSYQDLGEANATTTYVMFNGSGAESGATVHLLLTQGNQSKSVDVVANAAGLWQGAVLGSALTAPFFTTGAILVSATQTDVAGNTSAATTRTVALRNTPVDAVQNFSLATGEDTGLDTGDGITNHSAPKLVGQSTVGTVARIYVDTNDNGLVDNADVLVGQTEVGSNGQFELTITTLVDGTYTLLAQAYDPVSHTTSLTTASGAWMNLVVDTQVDPVVFDTIAGDNVVVLDELNNGVYITGHAEANAEVTVTYSAGGTTSRAVVMADANGQWRRILTTGEAITLGDGLITVEATQIDVAGNATSTASNTPFILKTSPVDAPTPLVLDANDDTGRSSTDGVTQLTSGLSFSAHTLANAQVTVFDDINKNGRLDSGEWLGQGTADTHGLFQTDVTLSEGVHLLRSFAIDSANQSSSSSVGTSVTLDTSITNPSGVRVAGNNKINALKAITTGAVSVEGVGEAGASVTLVWSTAGGVEVLRKTVNSVPGSGVWTLTLTNTEVAQLPQGTLGLKVQQTDVAGNVSAGVQTSVLVDTETPGTPNATESIAANNYNSSPDRAWADGLSWSDIYSDTNNDGVAEPRPLSVAVALTHGLISGDTVALNWAGQTVTQIINADDLARGYVLVAVDSGKIAAAGVRSGLSLTASFSDGAGNQGDAFTVLTGMNVTLDLRAPVLDFSDAHANTAPGANDAVLYTNNSTSNTDINKHYLSVSGQADPDSRVTIFVDANLNGVVDVNERVLAIAQSGSDGNFNTSFLNTLVDGTYKIRAYSNIGSQQSAMSDVVRLRVDTEPPLAPVISQSTFTPDNIINGSERDDGLVLSGTGEPFAMLSLHLENTSTGVMGSTDLVQVGADGRWGWPLRWDALGQVGDGALTFSISQTDLAGNLSLSATNLSFVQDTQVALPTLNPVGGDGFVNATEVSAGVTLHGGGEVGAWVFLRLRAGSVTVGPFTVPNRVNANGVWEYTLTASDLQSLGNADVTMEVNQQDVAGNWSAIQTQVFKIDTQVNAPTVDTVAGNDRINAAEKTNGITLSGQAELGALVTVTLKQAGQVDQQFTVQMGGSSVWSLPLSANQLAGYTDGALSIEVKQTDAAGNASVVGTKTVILATTPMSTPVVFDAVSGDNQVSLSEQTADVVLHGTGPADTNLTLMLSGKSGALEKTQVIGTDGQWQINLTHSDMATLGQGQVNWHASSRNGDDQSTAVVNSSFVLDKAEPSPAFSQVSGNGMVNAVEAHAGIDISGTGVVDHVVNVTLKGASLGQISRTVQVGSDGRWLLHLTEGDILLLGEGHASISAVQKTSSLVSALASVDVEGSFLIDTVAPLLPTAGDLAFSQNYNTDISALKNGVTVSEAGIGVTISVPKSSTLVAGDVVTLYWGAEKIQHIVTAADLQSAAILMTVGRDTITTQGSGVWDVTVVYTDMAGNNSVALTLVSGVSVTAPPQIPQIDSVSTDGYLNISERAAMDATHPLAITGSASGSGSVKLTLQGAHGQQVVLENLVVTGGVWTASLSADNLDSLGEGRITMSAVFTRSDAAVSLAGTGSWTYDRTAPSAPDVESVNNAGYANAISELAGGLIRLNGQITEAAYPVQVRVALPSNAASNDTVSLYWGGQASGEIITATVNQQAINEGFMVVTVPSSVISQHGDSSALKIQAMFTDRAGNNGAVFEVWTGVVDAVPLAPTIDSPSMGEWLNSSEASALWNFSGTSAVNGTVELTLVGASGHVVTRTVTAAGTNWSLVGSNRLTLADAQTLGDGEVTVYALQRDAGGNPSANATVNFKIDLSAPSAPQVNAVADMTYGQTQNGAQFTGAADAAASVTLDFVRANNHVYKTISAGDSGLWTASLSKDDFAALSANNATGTTTISATQTDLAGNPSIAATSTFNFSSLVITPPSIDAVTGLNTTSDGYLNSVELAANHGQLSLSGMGLANQKAHVTITVAGVPNEFDVDVASNGLWSLSLDTTQVTRLGQGEAILTATSRTFNNGVMDESVPTTFNAGGHGTFVIDTITPTLLQASISATGLNGNAKEGDEVRVTYVASEDLQWTATDATVVLNFGGQTRTAMFDTQASRAAGNNRLVFTYVVQANDNASSLSLDSMDLQSTQFNDAAGNPAGTTPTRILTNTVVVDTTPPAAPSITQVDEALGSSSGGPTINIEEATSSVHVRVTLPNTPNTGAKAGDTLVLKWNDITLNKILSLAEVTVGSATVSVSQSTVGSVDGTATLTSWLVDQSGNVSASSAAVTKTVDTIAPNVLTINTWMIDDKVNAVEAPFLSNITGGQVEANATVNASIRWGNASATPLTVLLDSTNHTWSISGVQLQTWLNSHTDDGKFTLSVWQTDVSGNIGNITQQHYYVDHGVPLSPTITSIGTAADGWINAAEANVGVTFDVSIAGSGAIAGDKIRLDGLGAGVYYELTAADIVAGSASVLVSGDGHITQALGASPMTNGSVTASIEDQGGNVSPASISRAIKIDTNVAQLTVDTSTGAAAGVSPAQSLAGLNFIGGGAETGATLKIVLTGALGNVLRLVPTIDSNGNFSQPIKPSDFKTLGDGVVSYELVQTDPAGNVSVAKTGSFNLALSISPPVLNDFAGDNIVGASEVGIAQTLSGTGVVGATVSVVLKNTATGGATLPDKYATVGTNGLWSVSVLANDFNTLLGAGVQRATVLISATASDGFTTSTPSLQTVQIVKATPTLGATPLALFDGNSDGANNDGLLISFSEAVSVAKLSSLTSSALTVSNNHTWGTGARIEAVNPATSNGSLFATQFKIYLGAGSTVAASDVITFSASNVMNTAQNLAAGNLQITVPSLVVPAAPTPPLNITTDNLINAAERAASTPIAFVLKQQVTAGSTLGVYRDGVFLKSVAMTATTAASSSTSIALTGAEWGSTDGQHTLFVQVTDAAGHTSAFSAPKSVVVDTAISAGMQSLRLQTDNGTLGSANPGDVLRVTFNEVVGISAASLPVGTFGTGATVVAVAAVGGKSASWDITLGTNPTLASGQNLTFTNVTDNAGNTGSVQNALVTSDVYNTPSLQIATVTTDNVIDGLERASAQAITLNLTRAKSGDVVKLFMDGLNVGTTTVGADGQSTLNVSIPVSGWGADGQRVLSATITRGSTTVSSLEHSVYVNADSTHWASVNAGTLWFDPDTLSLADGAQVTQWDAVTGKTTAGNALSVYTSKGAVLKTTDASGHVMLYFNGNSILSSNAFIQIPDINSGYADFSMFKQIVPVNTWAYTMTRYLGNGTATPYRHHFGTAQGYGLTSHFSGDGAGYLQTSPLNSTSINNWMILNGYGTGASINVALDGSTLLTRATTTAPNAGINATKYGVGGNIYSANYALMIGGTEDGFISGNGSAVTALMADQIAFNAAITTAQRGEVATYLASKYFSAGTQVLITQAGATYDLSLSATAGVLVNDMLQLQHGSLGIGSDTVITAGSDYVNTGAGDDTVILKDLAFRTLDGASGTDTLKLDASYSGRSAIVLADFVSNARGVSGDLAPTAAQIAANDRVNVAGFHKLQGFESIDLSTSSQRQVMTVAADDANQLSDNNTLAVLLGVNDVMLTTGFTSNTQGLYDYNGTWYDQKSDATVNGQAVTLYSRSGDQAADLTSFKPVGTSSLQLNFDHAMVGAPIAGEFTVAGLNSYSAPSLTSVGAVNLRQGLSLSFTSSLSGSIKLTYTGGLTDEAAGRSVLHKTWLVGTDGSDSINGSMLTASEQNAGLTILGGAGNDSLSGGRGADAISGGLGADTLTGGAGSDTFKYFNEIQDAGAAAGLGGTGGDVITDFNFGYQTVGANKVSSPADADRLDLSMLFDNTLGANGNAAHDAAALISGKFMDIVQTRVTISAGARKDWEVWVDRDGGGNYQRLVTLQGAGDAAPTDYATAETTSELLQKLLLEGRLTVAHA